MKRNNILDEIVSNKKKEQNSIRKQFGDLSFKNLTSRNCYSMSRSLQESSSGIIAEFKRRSPSKGEINPMADASVIIPGYASEGAAALSILTDTRYFGGSNTDLVLGRSLVSIPILRKDFIICERQIFEAHLIGADAILLIASCLTKEEIVRFTDLAHEIGLEVLLEIHNLSELEKYYPKVDMIGVNHRDLTTFSVDQELSYKVADKLPSEVLKIAESGLQNFEQVKQLRQVGYKGFLIGETFMKSSNPPLALKDFIAGDLC